MHAAPEDETGLLPNSVVSADMALAPLGTTQQNASPSADIEGTEDVRLTLIESRTSLSRAERARHLPLLTTALAASILLLMTLDPHEYYASLPKRRVGAGALLLDGTGNVLMVEPAYKEYWEIPGGIVENGEDPRQACQRECLEELGLRLALGRILVLEHQTEEPPFGDSIMFVYDGGVVPAGTPLVLPPGELRSYRFVPSDGLGEVTVERLACRIHFALVALREGSTIELTNGYRAI